VLNEKFWPLGVPLYMGLTAHYISNLRLVVRLIQRSRSTVSMGYKVSAM